MGNIGGMVAIMGVCGIVLLIGAMGKKVEWLVNFILRAVIGTIGIYFLNYLLAVQNISVSTEISTAIWTCMGYTVLLCFCLFKTSSLARSVFNAH